MAIKTYFGIEWKRKLNLLIGTNLSIYVDNIYFAHYSQRVIACALQKVTEKLWKLISIVEVWTVDLFEMKGNC